MAETVLSVGIDLGTTTTQLVFSRLEVENTAGASAVPRIKIIAKEVFHKSDIYFTPLINREIIDAPAVRRIIEGEYAKAGLTPADLSAGAVIITGETARKENSELVLESLSGLAGDFVVATAGSDLESIIAGRGAGTSALSRERPGTVWANLDIGGGTTNTAIFFDGEAVDTSCLDIGGRQIILDPKTLTPSYIAEKVKRLAHDTGLPLKEGRAADSRDLEKLCDRLAGILGESLGLKEPGPHLDLFITAHPLSRRPNLKGITFSGGVADCFYHPYPADKSYVYGDIGVVLGRALARADWIKRLEVVEPAETIRATVVGAGSYTMEISGSTIGYTDGNIFPLKNVPILKLLPEDEAADFDNLAGRLAAKLEWYKDEQGYQLVAIAFRGTPNPTFELIKKLTRQIVEGSHEMLGQLDTLIVVVENDLAKSLANSLANALGPSKKVLCLDGIRVENGDYIDLGKPLAAGRVVPVVIKTLVFGK